MTDQEKHECDKRLVGWVSDRAEGVPVVQLAAESGVGRGVISKATNIVRDADIAQSKTDISGAY